MTDLSVQDNKYKFRCQAGAVKSVRSQLEAVLGLGVEGCN